MRSPILRRGTEKVSRRAAGRFSSNTSVMRVVITGRWRVFSSKWLPAGPFICTSGSARACVAQRASPSSMAVAMARMGHGT